MSYVVCRMSYRVELDFFNIKKILSAKSMKFAVDKCLPNFSTLVTIIKVNFFYQQYPNPKMLILITIVEFFAIANFLRVLNASAKRPAFLHLVYDSCYKVQNKEHFSKLLQNVFSTAKRRKN